MKIFKLCHLKEHGLKAYTQLKKTLNNYMIIWESSWSLMGLLELIDLQ